MLGAEGLSAGRSRMTNMNAFIQFLKLTWIRRIFTTNSDWINIFSEITKCNINKLGQVGSEYCKHKAKITQNNFWKETLIYFAEFVEGFNSAKSHILCEPLWYNNKIKI